MWLLQSPSMSIQNPLTVKKTIEDQLYVPYVPTLKAIIDFYWEENYRLNLLVTYKWELSKNVPSIQALKLVHEQSWLCLGSWKSSIIIGTKV